MIQTEDFRHLTSGTRTESVWDDYARKTKYPVIQRESLDFLIVLARLMVPKTILEVGCGYGFCAYHLLNAVPFCHLTGIDFRKENEAVFRQLSQDSGVTDRFHFLAGPAGDRLDEIQASFDWVILDTDKKDYPVLAEKCLSRVNKGGLLIADNTLWQGRVAGLKPGKDPSAILWWNEWVYSNSELETVMIPVGDGLTVSRKRF